MFKGWYTAASGRSLYSTVTAITSAKTFYAQFTANTYTVTWDLGTGETATSNQTYGEKLVLPTEPEPEPAEEKSGSGGVLVILLLLALAGGGAFAYIKFIKPKQGVTVSADPDDYDFEDEELVNEDETEESE